MRCCRRPMRSEVWAASRARAVNILVEATKRPATEKQEVSLARRRGGTGRRRFFFFFFFFLSFFFLLASSSFPFALQPRARGDRSVRLVASKPPLTLGQQIGGLVVAETLQTVLRLNVVQRVRGLHGRDHLHHEAARAQHDAPLHRSRNCRQGKRKSPKSGQRSTILPQNQHNRVRVGRNGLLVRVWVAERCLYTSTFFFPSFVWCRCSAYLGAIAMRRNVLT